MDDDIQLYSAEQASRMLGISKRTLSRLVREGSISPYRIRRAVRFSRSQLIAFLESSSANSKEIDQKKRTIQNKMNRSLKTEYSGGSSESLFKRISHYVD